MPARLTVVITQSSRRDARTVDLEEEIVTRMMLSPGLDVALVASLDAIRLESTDHLCLHALPEEIALLGWLESVDAAAHWQRLNLVGMWTELPIVPAAENVLSGYSAPPAILGNSTKRVRYIKLSPEMSTDAIVGRVQSVLDNRRVQAVPIQLSPKARIQNFPNKTSNSPSAASATPTTFDSQTQATPANSGADVKNFEAVAKHMNAAVEPASQSQKNPAPADELAISKLAKMPYSTDSAFTKNDITNQLPTNHLPVIAQPAMHDANDDSLQWTSLDKLVDDLDALDL